MIVKALAHTTGELGELAAELGVSYHTLWSWKAGRRAPGPRHIFSLANALERRSGDLQELVEELRKAAEDLEREGRDREARP